MNKERERMFWHYSKEKHGVRAWWHFPGRKCIGVEFYWWSSRCGLTVGPDDEGWRLSLRIPPLACYLSLEGFPLWRPMKTWIATWDNNRPFTIPDRREFDLSISDWTVRCSLWGRWGEWASKDPWWIRGVSLDIKRLLRGKDTYTSEQIAAPVAISIPMPEGVYPAVATVTRSTWTRPRWFATRRTYVDVKIEKGIPYAGKGENSWDCDDDGLFGYSSEGASLERAIAKGVEHVLTSRRRYGAPSQESVREALNA